MKKLLTSLVLIAAIILPSLSSAQVTTATVVKKPVPVTVCTDLKYNMAFGSKDATTNGEVTVYQTFLQSKGYVKTNPTGIFNDATVTATKAFQKDNGLKQTGAVWDKTRATIQNMTCIPIFVYETVGLIAITAPGDVSTVTYTATVTGRDINGQPTPITDPYYVPSYVTLMLICPAGVSANFIGEDVNRCSNTKNFKMTKSGDLTYTSTVEVTNKNEGPQIIDSLAVVNNSTNNSITSDSIKVNIPGISTQPTVAIVSTNIELVYEENNRESQLRSDIKFKVDNNTDHNINLYNGWGGVNFIGSDGQASPTQTVTVMTSSSNVDEINDNNGNTMFVIEEGTIAYFTVTSVKYPSQMFGGFYYATLSYLYANNGTDNANVYNLIVPENRTDYQVIAGEKSPYITSASPQTNIDGTKVLGVYGVRLASSTPIVQCDGNVYEVITPVPGFINSSEELFFNISKLPAGALCSLQLNNPVYGYSNPISFEVPGSTTNKPPVISGITAPTTLKVDEMGTWRVQASDPENGSLSYSVDWGDNYAKGVAKTSAKMATPSYTQQTSFTHSYSSAGIYKVWFTVTDDNGLVAQSSATVNVGSVVIVNPLPVPKPLVPTPTLVPATTTPVVKPSITITSPNGGESLAAGQKHSVTYKLVSTNEQALLVTLLNESGKAVNSVLGNGTNGSYSISLPANTPVGKYKIKIDLTATDGTKISDTSDGYFNVTDKVSVEETGFYASIGNWFSSWFR